MNNSYLFIIKRFILVIVFICNSIAALSFDEYDFKVDDLYYKISRNEAVVTYYDRSYNSSEFSGDIIIPSSVCYAGKTYSITGIGENAFSGCTGITSVTIPSSVKWIGEKAFSSCFALTSISIPNSVISIGYSAFLNCKALTGITISSSITTIPDAMFEGCVNLTNIIIPDQVTTIGVDAFKNCTALTSVHLGNHVSRISKDAFYNCKNLVDISFPASVEYIAGYALHNTKWFANQEGEDGVVYAGSVAYSSKTLSQGTWITLKEGTKSISGRAFSESNTSIHRLAGITIPNTVTSIGEYAFTGCRISEIELPTSLESIEACAFEKTSLSKVEIPNSVKFIGRDAFAGTSWFSKQPDGVVYAGNFALGYKGQMSDRLSLREGTIAIVDEAFSEWNMTSIDFPHSLIYIGEYAFKDCKYLSEVIIPDAVTTIATDAFYNCYGIKNLSLGQSVTAIGGGAFAYCKELTKLMIPNSVTTIGNGAFYFCDGIIDLTIGTGVESMDHAFNNCSNIKRLTWNARNCFFSEYHDEPNVPTRNLESLVFGDQVEVIPDYFMYVIGSNRPQLTSIIIPKSVTYIGKYAFHNCGGITSIEIPENVSYIGDNAFAECSALTSVAISSIDAWCNIFFRSARSNPIFYAGHLYKNGEEIKKLVLPKTVNAIQDYAFYGCKELMEIRLSDEVTYVGKYAFGECRRLTEIIIPDKVTIIGNNAFDNCIALTSVTIGKSVKDIGYESFHNCSNLHIVNYNAVNCISADGMKSPVNMYYDRPSIYHLKIGDGVEHIPADVAMVNMESKYLVLPNSVKTIQSGAFPGKAKSVVIGNNIESIEKGSFSSGFNTAYVTSKTPRPCSSGAFDEPKVLYVPTGSKMDYFIAEGWCEFSSIIEKDFKDNYVLADSIILNYDSFTLGKTSTRQLVAKIMPDNSTARNVKWISSDPKIATVSSSGLVKAIKEGKVDIIAYVDNVIATCRVTVSHLMVENLTLNAESFMLDVNDMVTLKATVTPDNAENKTLEWEIPENEVIVTQVFNDTHSLNIGAVGEGSVAIIVRTTDGSNLSAQCIVTVGKALPGDVNGDGAVNITDLNSIINVILQGNSATEDGMDLNGDGVVNISDINILIGIILKS